MWRQYHEPKTTNQKNCRSYFKAKLNPSNKSWSKWYYSVGKNNICKRTSGRNKKRGLPVTRASIDDFHNPRAIRYAQGKESARGYYEDAHDYTAFKERLLKPLGPNGNLQYDTISHNLITDIPVHNGQLLAQPNMVLIVDGTFLLKKT